MKDIGRFHAFSDGVFAILITILVLEFRIPEFKPGHLGDALAAQLPTFFAYLMSYLYVGTLWLFHHDYFSYLKHVNRKINMMNLLLLFSITLIDYPLYIMSASLSSGNQQDLRISIILYAVVAMFVSFNFFLIYRYVHQHPELQHKIPESVFNEIKNDPIKSVTIYGLAIASTYWSIYLSILLVIAGILFHFIAYIRISSRLERDGTGKEMIK